MRKLKNITTALIISVIVFMFIYGSTLIFMNLINKCYEKDFDAIPHSVTSKAVGP
jgi:hypothetical protein